LWFGINRGRGKSFKINRIIFLKSGKIHWRNTAQWCKNTLMQEGLLKSDSPKGIWEITEKGVEYLKKWNKDNIISFKKGSKKVRR